MRGLILSTALGAAALAGCYATGDVGYSASATYSSAPAEDGYAATPDLVTVQPGVQVVADYDEPVFFVDGFYWRFYDGYWYRSGNYAYGWYYWDRPPVAVLRIDRPYAYAHYRPVGYVARRNVRYRPPAARRSTSRSRSCSSGTRSRRRTASRSRRQRTRARRSRRRPGRPGSR